MHVRVGVCFKSSTMASPSAFLKPLRMLAGTFSHCLLSKNSRLLARLMASPASANPGLLRSLPSKCGMKASPSSDRLSSLFPNFGLKNTAPSSGTYILAHPHESLRTLLWLVRIEACLHGLGLECSWKGIWEKKRRFPLSLFQYQKICGKMQKKQNRKKK